MSEKHNNFVHTDSSFARFLYSQRDLLTKDSRYIKRNAKDRLGLPRYSLLIAASRSEL